MSLLLENRKQESPVAKLLLHPGLSSQEGFNHPTGFRGGRRVCQAESLHACACKIDVHVCDLVDPGAEAGQEAG